MLSGWERPSHWLVLAVVVVVLFGYKKLPDASRAVGRSLRIFKTELKGMNEDDAARETTATTAEVPTPAPATPAAGPASAPVTPAVITPAVVTPAVVEASPSAAAPAAPVIQPVLMQQPPQLVDNPAPVAQAPHQQPSN
jgi:sec-independent protein translocase protein TatA